jgi:cytochrome c-type biogenesis protein CcmH/NrfG
LKLTERAGQVWNEREAKDPALIQGLSLIQGKILADLGDATAAERAFDQEIRLFPKDPRAYSNLAILYALSGRPAEVGPTLQKMVAESPTPGAYAEAVRALRTLKDEASARNLLRYALGRFPGSPELRELGRAG